MNWYLIPKSNDDHTNYPCWVPVVDSNNNKLKPIIRCKCGIYLGIGLHHVHSDGTVTASFYHRDGREENDNKGCGFHEHLKLENWTGEEYLPKNPDSNTK